ncbi:MAG: hypothetical protein QGG36_09470 [Pirellulaceae bacterium]|jgi:hypothetical protein|nr:hypothetical protein [Pirellulaceae bacterium]MDP7016016.1 hypothetical protein [Pirellulaceae bacterium]
MSNTEFDRGHAGEVVKELKSFLGTLSERTPQEALGITNESGLASGTIAAIGGFLVLLALFTAGPYYWHYLPFGEQSVTDAKPATAAAVDTNTGDTAPASVPDAGATGAGASGSEAPVANPDEVLDTLGIGEAKEAPADQNPRESDLDKLLDGIK